MEGSELALPLSTGENSNGSFGEITSAAYPRQHELALALREIGRVERTLFVIEWLLDADMQRRV